MKKILLSTAAIALLFASSCKKSDDNNGGGSGLGNNQFTVGSTTYTATSVQAVGQNLVAIAVSGSTGNTVSFTFSGSSLPATGGTFRVVSSSSSLAANQVAVTSVNGTTSVGYYSTGNDKVDATVTISGGKVGINMPKIWAKSTATTPDSVQIAANVTQQ